MCYDIGTMKKTLLVLAACMLGLCCSAQQEKAQTVVLRDEPTLEEYKKMIFDAGGTGVYEAQGVDIMLADGVPVALAVKEVGVAKAEQLPDDSLQADSATIATWNANWFPCGRMAQQFERKPTAEKQNTEFAAGYLAEQRPGIIVMTGIYDPAALSGLKEWKAGIVSRFTHKGTVPPKQIAILSKSSPVDSGAVEFEAQYGVEPPRGFVWAVYKVLEMKVAVIGVDLKANAKSKKKPQKDEGDELPDGIDEDKLNIAKRETSARQIVAFAESLVAKRKADAIIVAGDFKTDLDMHGERTQAILEEGGFKHNCANSPDYIFTRGDLLLECKPLDKSPLCRFPMLSAKLSLDRRAIMTR